MLWNIHCKTQKTLITFWGWTHLWNDVNLLQVFGLPQRMKKIRFTFSFEESNYSRWHTNVLPELSGGRTLLLRWIKGLFRTCKWLDKLHWELPPRWPAPARSSLLQTASMRMCLTRGGQAEVCHSSSVYSWPQITPGNTLFPALGMTVSCCWGKKRICQNETQLHWELSILNGNTVVATSVSQIILRAYGNMTTLEWHSAHREMAGFGIPIQEASKNNKRQDFLKNTMNSNEFRK